ncbi:MAG: hypothetical protein ACOX0T_07515 [Pelotomaculum sp.]
MAIDLENEVSTEELWLWDTRNQVAVCAAEMALLSLWRLLKRQGL